MSVSKLPNGKYRVRWRDARNVQHARHFTHKAEAVRFDNSTQADLARGTYIDASAAKTSVREVGEKWLASHHGRESTRALYERQLRLHVYPTLGDVPIGRLRPSDIQAWATALAGRRGADLVHQAYSRLASICKRAVADRMIAETPCRDIKLAKIVRQPVVPLTVDEVRTIIEHAPPRLSALITLAATTGLRSGELLGLTNDNVLWLRRRVRVCRQLVYIPGRPPFLQEMPKTEASYREVPVPPFALDLLARHCEQLSVGDHELIFQSRTRGPIRRNNLWKQWQEILRRTEMSKELHFHHLRHHYASLLIFGGESVVTVSKRLGHASTAETLKTYAHLWPDSEAKTRLVLEEAWKNEDSVRTEGQFPASDLGGWR